MGKFNRFCNRIVKFSSDLGGWLSEKSKKKTNAIILVILSILSPIGFIFATSLIAYSYRKGKKKR